MCHREIGGLLFTNGNFCQPTALANFIDHVCSVSYYHMKQYEVYTLITDRWVL